MLDQVQAKQLSSGINKALFAYWLEIAKGETIPLRNDLDPVNIDPLVLPHIFLCSLGYNPFSVHFRLQGTFITEYLGQTFTGKELSEEIFGAAADNIRDLYKRVADGKNPVVSHELVSSENGDEVSIEVLHLPLSDEIGQISYILGSIDVFDEDYSRAKNFTSKYWIIKDSEEVLLK